MIATYPSISIPQSFYGHPTYVSLRKTQQYTQQVNVCSLFGVRIDAYNECIRDVMFKIDTIIGPLEFGWEKCLNQVPSTTPLFQNCWTVIDATECNIEQLQDYRIQELYYSGKKKRHTMKYHVVCNITNGQIIDVHGPFFGKNHDITIARSWIEDRQIQIGYIGRQCLHWFTEMFDTY
ncbi:IS5 family transposase [Acrasis kona]|uniref:IS5 family transposase n=1 Tax=Acrasis kona TaxID=1008807 RepID=A0AAW2YSP7_9EUKA